MTTGTTQKTQPESQRPKQPCAPRKTPAANSAARQPDYPGTLSLIAEANPEFKVLIVDDSRATRVLVRSILNACGISGVRDAIDGAEALEYIEESTPDLIISDVQMAPLDGIELSRLIRKNTRAPNPPMPIVIITAYTEQDRIVALLKAGLKDVVAKPISPKMLCRSIVTALQNSGIGPPPE